MDNGLVDSSQSDSGYTDSDSKDVAKGNAAYRNAAKRNDTDKRGYRWEIRFRNNIIRDGLPFRWSGFHTVCPTTEKNVDPILYFNCGREYTLYN